MLYKFWIILDKNLYIYVHNLFSLRIAMLRVEIWNIILILAKRQIDEHILLSLFSQLSISFLPWKLNRKPASVLRKTQIETLFCHKTQDCIFVEANPWNWSREQKHCTISVMPRFHIPNFATRTISEKDVDEEQHYVENVSPHPLRWGLFGSCPLALWRRSLLEKWQYLCPLLFTGQYLCFLENNPDLTCNIRRDKPPSNFASVELWEFENEFYCYLNVFDPLRKVFHFIRCLWSLKASFCISNNSQ